MIDAGGRYIEERLVDSVMLEAVRGQGYSESTNTVKVPKSLLAKCEQM